jgi:hypothetical protein
MMATSTRIHIADDNHVSAESSIAAVPHPDHLKNDESGGGSAQGDNLRRIVSPLDRVNSVRNSLQIPSKRESESSVATHTHRSIDPTANFLRSRSVIGLNILETFAEEEEELGDDTDNNYTSEELDLSFNLSANISQVCRLALELRLTIIILCF